MTLRLLEALAHLFLTMAGYSAGAALAARGRRVRPSLLDIGAAACLCISAALVPRIYGRFSDVGLCVGTGLIVGLLLSMVRPVIQEKARGHVYSATRMDAASRFGWLDVLKRFGLHMGDFQGRLLLGFFYFSMVMPLGITIRLFSDPLHIRLRGMSSWSERPAQGEGIDAAREQF